MSNKGVKKTYKECLLEIANVIERENPCRDCFGTGKFLADSMGVLGYQLHPCPRCKGTGKEPSTEGEVGDTSENKIIA